MRVELKSFLDQHAISHPTRLVGIELASKTVSLSLEGYPWWKNAIQPTSDGRIRFVFEGIESGQLDLQVVSTLNETYSNEVLEDFSITANEPGDWTDKTEVSIICQSALPDPLGLYARMHSFLQYHDIALGPRDVLNCPPGKLSRFAVLTSSSHYVVAKAPHKIAAFICADLDSQAVSYYQLKGSNLFSPRFVVRWYGSIFTCEAAFAEFD